MSGRLDIIGLGPGPEHWLTPEARAALAEANDIFGYGPYVARLAPSACQRIHASDNRFEGARAAEALEMAATGQHVAVVSGGDPGIFAMSAAVFEAVETGAARWRLLDIRVMPGISAILAASARLGAPLGHDFCVLSLSDNLKPWAIIAKRLNAAIEGDFVVALYNPASKARPLPIHAAFDILRAGKVGTTPVAFARAIGRSDEQIVRTTLAKADPAIADMSTLVLIGSSQTRWLAHAGADHWMLTPRNYVAPR